MFDVTLNLDMSTTFPSTLGFMMRPSLGSLLDVSLLISKNIKGVVECDSGNTRGKGLEAEKKKRKIQCGMSQEVRVEQRRL